MTTFHVERGFEAQGKQRWVLVMGSQGRKAFAEGYYAACTDKLPHPAYRLVRVDCGGEHVVDEVHARKIHVGPPKPKSKKRYVFYPTIQPSCDDAGAVFTTREAADRWGLEESRRRHRDSSLDDSFSYDDNIDSDYWAVQRIELIDESEHASSE